MARIAVSVALVVAAVPFLNGCGSINTWMAEKFSNIPQWAGGLPPDAPPRPGTVAYDEYAKKVAGTPDQPAPKDKPPQPNETAPKGLY